MQHGANALLNACQCPNGRLDVVRWLIEDKVVDCHSERDYVSLEPGTAATAIYRQFPSHVAWAVTSGVCDSGAAGIHGVSASVPLWKRRRREVSCRSRRGGLEGGQGSGDPSWGWC